MLADQEATQRLTKPQSGSCLHCHASIMPLYRQLGGGDPFKGLDATAARVALESGRPYLVGLPDGVSMACHSALLAPGDAAPWILNRSAAPTRPGGRRSYRA